MQHAHRHAGQNFADADTDADDGVQLCVRGGVLEVIGGGDRPGRLTWPAEVRVFVDDASCPGRSCSVAAGSSVRVDLEDGPAEILYEVTVAADRMEAHLHIDRRSGTTRRLADQPAASSLHLRIDEQRTRAPEPTRSDAIAALRAAAIVHGIDDDAVRDLVVRSVHSDAAPVRAPVARGTPPAWGTNGTLEPLVDWAAVARSGVRSGTPLLRRVPCVPGSPGRDVTDQVVSVPRVRDAPLICGDGAELSDVNAAPAAVAAVDGLPVFDGSSRVEVRPELVLGTVDATTGDIGFLGSVHVTGSVREGRLVHAGGAVRIDGAVDRARITAGGDIAVVGAIMSSVLRAGGDRAVAAGIADRVTAMPERLADIATRARELRDAGTARGSAMSHGLSVQLVVERMHRTLLADLASVATDLAAAGEPHAERAAAFHTWHRCLATAGSRQLTEEGLLELVAGVGDVADAVRDALRSPSSIHVTSMQASEAEATGQITIDGRGVFSSRLAAWGGLVAVSTTAVVRGGSITSHGAVRLAGLGSPAGTSTHVQLGVGASLVADRVHAGVTVAGPRHAHGFVTDRSDVRVQVGPDGEMDVSSLAA